MFDDAAAALRVQVCAFDAHAIHQMPLMLFFCAAFFRRHLPPMLTRQRTPAKRLIASFTMSNMPERVQRAEDVTPAAALMGQRPRLASPDRVCRA